MINRRYTILWMLIVWMGVSVSCSFPAMVGTGEKTSSAGLLDASKPENIVAAPENVQMGQAPDVAGGAPGQGGGGEVYPSTPEGVIYEFLSVYQIDPALMNFYLSNDRLNEMPQGGAVELAGLHGLLEGFGILTASVSPQPAAALVTVALRLDGQETTRSFRLVQQNGQWVIDSIDQH